MGSVRTDMATDLLEPDRRNWSGQPVDLNRAGFAGG
jgi:hypothetical protein